jgi:outer membrane lipoprotein carrier protein
MGFRLPTAAARGIAVAAALLVWAGAFPATAAPAGTPLQGEERARAIEALQARQREVRALRASVVQRKRHPLLKDEAITEGVLLFSRPRRVRWEVATPERTIVVIDDQALVIYRPDRMEAERRDLGDDFGARAVLEFLAAGMSFDVPALEKRFQMDVSREGGGLSLVLIPRSRWIARAVASVTITQEDADGLPRRIVVLGQKGERTETLLTQVVVNPPLSDDAFTLRLGPGVRVVQVGHPGQETGGGR